MMKRLQQFKPYHIAYTLNKTERRGNLGAPIDLFLQRPSRTLSPKSQNTVLDIVANKAARKKKALKKPHQQTEGSIGTFLSKDHGL